MPAMFRDRFSGHLFRILTGLTTLYGILTVALRPAQLILLLNGLALSVSAGVVVAYLPVAGHALRRPAPSRGDVLGSGIFFAGLSSLALRMESLVARNFSEPFILNTDIAAVSIFLGLPSLICFLWAPYASDGRVPREKWGFAGLVVAAGVAMAFTIGVAHRFITPSPLFRFG